jgi:UDP-glucose:glycoprotein glucosyltransferase
VFGEDSEWDVGRQLARDFYERSGFKETPQVLMNGVPFEQKSLNNEDFEEAMMMAIMKTTNELQKAVYKNQLKDSDDVLDYLMKQSNIMPRLNDRILKGDTSDYVAMTGDVLPSLKTATFSALSKSGMAATMADHLRYLSLKGEEKEKLQVLTAWVVADLETEQGREALAAAAAHVKSSSLMRVGVVHNALKPGLMSTIIQAVLETVEDAKAARQVLLKVLKEETVKGLESGKKKLTDYDIPEVDMKELTEVRRRNGSIFKYLTVRL